VSIRVRQGNPAFARSAEAVRRRGTPDPQELIRAILKAPVDLIFFGASVPISAPRTRATRRRRPRQRSRTRYRKDLRCKVIGEGANLGMTQRGASRRAFRHPAQYRRDRQLGRRQYLRHGVNIKIALSIPLRDGRLVMSARNALLAELTDEVAGSYCATITCRRLRCRFPSARMEDFGFPPAAIQTLEARLLDRAVEYLPDDMQLAERRRRSQPFTRPELSVLLAYAKLTLYEDLLETAVPDDPYLGRELGRYFRKQSRALSDALEQHRLRREIIATHLANSMINRGGPR